ncbi:MAG TPA: ABC transporter permease, partial [Solirubrobacteraceae bacterium]|nr:ABC transporter permease [Solirubrobacteraceae bacterium]
MTRVALRGLLGRKLRAALTALAIVIGVAMVSGTFVLTDTIKSAFSTVFTQAYKNADAVISGKSAISNANGNGPGGEVPSLPASLLTRVRALPGVSQADGGIADQAQLVGPNGKVISSGGAPGLAFSHTPEGQRFNPLSLTSGRYPSGPGEVNIDTATASKKGFKVGDDIGIIARGPVEHFRIVGTVKFAGVSSLGGATMAIFTLPEAQRLFHKQGRYDQINVAAKSGTSPAQLVSQIKPLLGPSAQVRTGQGQAAQATKDTSGFLNIFQDFLLAFGGIALFVGSFVIANTLSITIAQRTRELATLRTLGATRRQVLGSVLVEAFVIGTIASVVGLFAGLLLAKALNSLLVSFGIDLPQASTVFKARTIIVALVVGIVITIIAAMRPALRSTRVPPIAAAREGAILPESRWAKFGPYAAGATIVLAIVLMLVGLLASGLSTGLALLFVGVGAVALFIGVAMLAPKLVPPLVRVLGWPAKRFGGAVNKAFVANYAVTAENNFSPISLSSEKAIRNVSGVTVVSGVRAGTARAFGSNINLTAVEPNVARVINIDWQDGSQAVTAKLGTDGAFVDKDFAKSHHLQVGSPLAVET